MPFTDVAFDAASFHTRAPNVWTWSVASTNLIYYRVQVVDGTATAQIYVEQGSDVSDDGGGVGPTHLCVDLPSGVVASAYAQQQLHYTIDGNYADFPNDGLVIVETGVNAGSLQVTRMGARWPPGVNVAFWATITFPVAA